MNVFAVREIMKFAKNFAINNGPIFLEFDTYRYQGHSMSDPGISYRTRDEVVNVRTQRDCISKVGGLILKAGWATEQELKVISKLILFQKIEKDLKDDMEQQVEKIRKDPLPSESELYSDVYIKEDTFIRGVEYENSFFPQK